MNEVVEYKSEENHAVITINNGKVNAISHEVIDGLNAAFNKAEEDQKIVILTGQKGIFSAGYDLKTMQKSAEAAKELAIKGFRISLRMLSFPTPIIIACTGHAVAKGAFMLLYGDYRIGVEGSFKIGLNEVMIGMTMPYTGIELARARLIPAYFERSINNAELYSPKEAVIAGFFDVIVPEEELLSTAIKTVTLFEKLNPKAHAETKLRLRKPYLEKIKKAIEFDLKSELTINS